ncbi:MAG: hypothetical protein LBC75_06490 [Fibromonadaceae bacterium]|jgi:hypothetical protein|nr:hypothetical protein [Fibromonadaceae bacterium]
MLKILTLSIIISFALLFLSNCSSDDPYISDISQCLEKASKFTALEDEQPVESEKFAVLTISGGKTHVHLDEIGLYCDSNLKLKTSYARDTLKLKEYWEDEGNMSMTSCSCVSSLDLTLESKYNNVKYLVYAHALGGRNQIFPVRYE